MGHNATGLLSSFPNGGVKAEEVLKAKDGVKSAVEESPFEGPSTLSYDEYEAASDSDMIIFHDRTYTPTAMDVGCCLRVEVAAHSSVDHSVLAGPVITFSEPVLSAPKPPPKRPLITVPGSATFSGVRFRVLTYNVLAEMYATRQIYPSCDSWILSWPYRRTILMHELSEAQGDIVCLQELQYDHYEHYLLPFMFSLGYESIFTQKSRESQGVYGKVDGCATFWKRSKFVMIENYDIEFNEVARRVASELGLDDAERRRFMNKLSKDNIAQLIVLDTSQSRQQLRGGRTAICVVNTHLYANKNQPEVKLWQTLALVNEVESFVVERDLALMMCGDFNSEPVSSVYELLSEAGVVNARPEVDGSESSVYLPDAGNITHNLDVASAMNTVLKSEPAFTNYTTNYKGTLDYIWYTPSRIKVMACTALPDEKDLLEFGDALPNAVYPSDHLMLCCDVALSSQGGSVLRNPNRKNITTPLATRASNNKNNNGRNNSMQSGR